jgi:NAD(P)-dependent dehydrogenase (short-subunit alcohol dehydrogenase family)
VTVAVVTGGGHGIGRALCRRLHRDGLTVVVADIEADAAQNVADEIGGIARTLDVTDEAAIVAMIDEIERDVGPIDLFISNAGVAFGDGESGAISREGSLVPADDRWSLSWQINVMAHVYAARELVPRMLARGGGQLINTVSAAGLLSQLGDAAYTATKAAAMAFAESLAIEYGDRGIAVSAVCPQAVATRLIGLEDDAESTEGGGFGGNDIDGIMMPEDVADIIIDGANEGRFLILTHPQVTGYVQRKAADHDRWIEGMRRFRDKVMPKA